MYTLSLEIINKCNLNCTYCYLGEKEKYIHEFRNGSKGNRYCGP